MKLWKPPNVSEFIVAFPPGTKQLRISFWTSGYCEACGWRIAAECVDHGISGARDDRPALKQVMDLAHKRKIDTLLVWRFARSLAHLVNSLEELRRLGVDFISYQESVDTSTLQGRMVFGIMASLAEFERALIQERIRSGLRRATAQGRRLGRPKAAVDPTKARQMRNEGRSIREITTGRYRLARVL